MSNNLKRKVNPDMESTSSKLSKLETQSLLFKKLSENGRAPERKSADAAGFDLMSAEDATLQPGSSALIPTDISIQCPAGTYGRIAPRSGLAILGLDVAAGVIDRDYRGNVKILLRNHAKVTVKILKHQRIAQLILERILTPHVKEVIDLDSSVRGANGFGSTD